MVRSGVDPLTRLYDLWRPDEEFPKPVDRRPSEQGGSEPCSSAPGAESSTVQDTDAAPTPKPRQPSLPVRMLFQSPSCPETLQKPDGSQWYTSDFRLKKQLSSSDTCTVYLAQFRGTKQRLALKVHFKAQLSVIRKHQLARELAIHSQMDHPNILKLYAVFEDEKTICMVMQYAAGGDLMGTLMKLPSQKMTEETARPVIAQLLAALQYLHRRNIIHRDIKPENLLISSDGTVQLTDFGVCIDASKERPVSAVGTLDYMSPEASNCPLKSRPSHYKERTDLHYTTAVDIWAVGILACDLVGGGTPFEQGSNEEIKQAVQSAKLSLPRGLSTSLRQFVTLTTAASPSQRPSASRLLFHDWLQTSEDKASAAGLRQVPQPPLRPTIESHAGPASSQPPSLARTFSLTPKPKAPLVSLSVDSALLPPSSAAPAVSSEAKQPPSLSRSLSLSANAKPGLASVDSMQPTSAAASALNPDSSPPRLLHRSMSLSAHSQPPLVNVDGMRPPSSAGLAAKLDSARLDSVPSGAPKPPLSMPSGIAKVLPRQPQRGPEHWSLKKSQSLSIRVGADGSLLGRRSSVPDSAGKLPTFLRMPSRGRKEERAENPAQRQGSLPAPSGQQLSSRVVKSLSPLRRTASVT